jgi:hypothetical protein
LIFSGWSAPVGNDSNIQTLPCEGGGEQNKKCAGTWGRQFDEEECEECIGPAHAVDHPSRASELLQNDVAVDCKNLNP